MLWENGETQKAIELIKSMAQGATAEELSKLLDLAEKRKPPGYDHHSRQVAQRFASNQVEIVRTLLQQRYPHAQVQMPATPLGWMRFIASQDAGVYDEEPDRPLVDAESKEPVGDDDDRIADWRRHLETALIAAVMPDVEERSIAVGTVAIHVSFVPTPGGEAGDGRLSMQVFMPHDVAVLCHWAHPSDEDYAYFFALRCSSPDVESEGEWWWVWSREVQDKYEVGEDGKPVSFQQPAFGPWHHVMLSTKGEQRGVLARAERYAGSRLPIVLFHSGRPQGSLFVDQDRDLVAVVDELNISRSNEHYVTDMQGHDQAWISGTKEAQDVVTGPDKIIQLLPGEQAGLLSPNPKLEDMRDGRKLDARELAATRGNSPDAYAVEPGPPLSGVSRKMANLPHERVLRRRRLLCRSIEEHRLLPMMLDVINTFSLDTIEGVIPKMTPKVPEDFEEPEAKRARAEADFNMGVISHARYAVEAGRYPNVAAAVDAGLSNDLRGAKPGLQAGLPPASPLAARLLAQRAARGEEPATIPEAPAVEEE